MTNYALLNNDDHQDVRVITERGSRYGDNVMYSLTFPFEFRSVQAFYPILFHADAKGEPYPVALFGFQENENLFLDDARWDAAYLPAMMRREPFLIGHQGSEAQPDDERARVLSIDMDHPRVSTEEGERLFQELGARTLFLDGVVDLMEQIYAGYVHNRTLMSALKEHDLLETATFDITLNDGSLNQLLGFSVLNEDKFQKLPGEVLASFNQQNILMPLFMVLASTVNMRSLIERKNRRLGI